MWSIFNILPWLSQGRSHTLSAICNRLIGSVIVAERKPYYRRLLLYFDVLMFWCFDVSIIDFCLLQDAIWPGLSCTYFILLHCTYYMFPRPLVPLASVIYISSLPAIRLTESFGACLISPFHRRMYFSVRVYPAWMRKLDCLSNMQDLPCRPCRRDSAVGFRVLRRLDKRVWSAFCYQVRI